MNQNVTVQLDQSIIHDAKILAAKRSTSLSKFLADEIKKMAAQDSTYDKVKALALTRLSHGYSLGGRKMPNRSEIYNR